MSIKVFFNESCSICKKEIDIYKKMENKLEWYDINEKESQITKLNWLYKILKQPILFHIFAFLYETAAIVLYLKNKFKKN